MSPGSLLALAYPDRIAKNRGGGGGAFLLANGRGGNVDPASPLAREPFLAVAELTGAAAASRIVLAAPIALAEIEARFAGKIEDREAVTLRCRLRFAARAAQPPAGRAGAGRADQAGRARCRQRETAGARALPRSASASCRGARRNCNCAIACCSCAGRKARSGPICPTTRSRAPPPTGWRRSSTGKTALSQIGADDLVRRARCTCCRGICASGSTPRRRPISPRRPARTCRSTTRPRRGRSVSIRVQELFGLAAHPAIAGGRVPLVIELLSPAHRPVQVTRDLPGFWRGSYEDVKTEMRGRYPKHPWPDDPLSAPATRRAKRRGE